MRRSGSRPGSRAGAEAGGAGPDYPVCAHRAFAPEEGLEHERARGHQLAYAEGDHREGGRPLLGGDVAEDHGEGEAAKAAGQRHQLRGQPEHPVLHRVEHVRGAVAAEPEEHRVAERQESGLAHLHVVAQREDGHHAHLAEHGHDEAGVAGTAPVVEEPRQDERHGEGEEPRAVAPQEAGHAGRRDRAGAGMGEGLVHVSRVPMRPRGLKSRMTISITNGRSAPMRGRGMVRSSANGVLAVTLTPTAARASAREYSSTTAKVCTKPMIRDAMKQPASDPSPPKTTTTNTMGPIVKAIDGSVTR